MQHIDDRNVTQGDDVYTLPAHSLMKMTFWTSSGQLEDKALTKVCRTLIDVLH